MLTNPQPSLESRVSALEHGQIITNARLEEMASYTTTGYKQLAEHLGKIDNRLDTIETTMATKDDIASVESRLNIIESTMVTKDDIANMATKDDLANMATKDDLNNLAFKIVQAFSQEMDKHVLRYHQ